MNELKNPVINTKYLKTKYKKNIECTTNEWITKYSI